MKKLFSLIALLTLCTAFLMASCAKPTPPPHVITEETINSSVYKKLDELCTFKTATSLTNLNEYQLQSTTSKLAYFKNFSSSKYLIYDLKNNKTIIEKTSTSTITYDYEFLFDLAVVEYCENSFTGKTTTTLYDYTGNEIASKENSTKLIAEEYLENFVKIGTDYYCVNHNGSISYAFNSEFKAMPNSTTYIGYSQLNNVYIFMSGSNIFAYDKAFNLLDYYSIPSYATLTAKPFVYEKGSFIVQYYYNVEMDAEKFSFVDDDGKKMKIDTILYNIVNDTRAYIDCSFMFTDNSRFSNAYTVKYNDYYIPKDVSGLVYNEFYEINNTNYKLSLETNAMVFLYSNSTAKRYLGMVNSQSFDFLPIELPNNLFYAKLVNGQHILVSAEGFAKDTLENISYNQNYLLINNKLYDYEGNVINIDGYNVYKLLSHGVLLEKDGLYSLLINDNITQICSTSQLTAFESLTYCDGVMLYRVKTTSGSNTSYNYYNGKGELITTTTKEFVPLLIEENSTSCILKAVSSNEYMLLN